MNVIGTGVSSSPALAVTVSAAAEQLAPCTTTLSGTSAVITWPATSSYHSSLVTAYKILIKNAAGAYVESAECNGALTSVVTNQYCSVAMSTLTSTYSLTAGTPIIAQVSAYNAGGWSPYSIDNTAYITAIREPLAAPVASISSASETAITVTWTQIATTTSSNGGSVVTGYSVELSTDGTNFGSPASVSGISTLTYTYTPATEGALYYFRVKAVNAFGTSLVSSNYVHTLAAQVPDQITPAPTLVLSGINVVVTWTTSPNTHSSSVTAYRIKFL